MTARLSFWRADTDTPPPPGAFVALIPGETAVTHTVDLPGRVRGGARAGIARRQLADRLALPPGAAELHGVRGTGWCAVVVTDAERMAALRARVMASGDRCRAILPDYLALPTQDEGWVLHLDGPQDAPRVVARLSPGFGFAADWPLAVELLRLSDPRPRRIDVHGPLAGEVRQVLEGFAEVRHHGADTPALVAPTKAAWPVDLREDHAAVVRRIATGLRRWRATAALLLLVALAWPAAEWLRLERAEAGLRAANTAAERLLRDTFIPTGPILDARAQVARITADAAAGRDDGPERPDPLALLARAAPLMLAAGASVQSVSHGAGQGLSVTLDVASFGALDALVADLRASGMRLSVPQSAVTEAGQTRAVLRIEPA